MKSLAASWYCSDCPKAAVRPAPNRTVRAMVMKEVIQVERRDQNLIHSACTERRRVWRPWMRERAGRGVGPVGVVPTALRTGAGPAGAAEACAGVWVLMADLLE